jgi:hypothetical protein
MAQAAPDLQGHDPEATFRLVTDAACAKGNPCDDVGLSLVRERRSGETLAATGETRPRC